VIESNLVMSLNPIYIRPIAALCIIRDVCHAPGTPTDNSALSVMSWADDRFRSYSPRSADLPCTVVMLASVWLSHLYAANWINFVKQITTIVPWTKGFGLGLTSGLKKTSFFENVLSFHFFNFLGFNVRSPDIKYDPKIHEAHLIHYTPFPCHIIYSHVQSIA